MTCGRENAAAVDIENGGSLCAFELTWAHHPTTGVSGCFSAGATSLRDCLVTAPGESDDVEQAHKALDQQRLLLRIE